MLSKESTDVSPGTSSLASMERAKRRLGEISRWKRLRVAPSVERGDGGRASPSSRGRGVSPESSVPAFFIQLPKLKEPGSSGNARRLPEGSWEASATAGHKAEKVIARKACFFI